MAVTDGDQTKASSARRPAPTGRRRGRPPDTDSAETRQAILDAARALFSERGYGAVTNKEVADAVGITPGSLYHYVESKLDLYVAVHRDLQHRIYSTYQAALDSATTFAGKLVAVLDATADLTERDPSMAAFVGAVRADMRRFPEVADRLERHAAVRERFFVDIVDVGVETGEIAPEDQPLAVEFVRLTLVGLTESFAEPSTQVRCTIESVKRLLLGTLVRPVPPTP